MAAGIPVFVDEDGSWSLVLGGQFAGGVQNVGNQPLVGRVVDTVSGVPADGLGGFQIGIIPINIEVLASESLYVRSAGGEGVVIGIRGFLEGFENGVLLAQVANGMYIAGLFIQAGGKIVVGGTLYNGSTSVEGALTRYNPSGSLDNTFGSYGIGMITLPPLTDPPIEISSVDVRCFGVQSTGKIMITGTQSYGVDAPGFFLCRFTEDGQLDTTYAADGYAIAPSFPIPVDVGCLFVQDDDKTLLIITVGAGDIGFMSRNLANGDSDLSFGDGGSIFVSILNFEVYFNSVVQLDDLSIIVLGSMVDTNTAAITTVLFGFTPDGIIDGTFGVGGIASIAATSINEWAGLIKQADGKIVAHPGPDTAVAGKLIRWNVDGTLDATFGVGGIASVASPTLVNWQQVIQQADGKLVAVGTDTVADAAELIRFSALGVPDAGFGAAGVVVFPNPVPSTLGMFNKVAQQSDGKLVIAGQVSDGGAPNPVVITRFNTDGTLAT